MLNKNIMNVVNATLENNNPKFELNHIFMDDESLVVTDTRFLIVVKHDLDIKENVLVLNQKAKFQIESDGSYDLLGVPYNISTIHVKGYPEYKRIQCQRFDHIQLTTPLDGLTLLYKLCQENQITLDFVKKATLYKKIEKIDFTYYRVNGYKSPITIGNKDIEIIIIPMVLNEVVL